MTDKELKKLNRLELLEILVKQQERIEELEGQLASANERLEDRQIIIMEAGSLAEASLELTKIFSAAQEAADLYLENYKNMVNSGLIDECQPEYQSPGPASRRHTAQGSAKTGETGPEPSEQPS